MKKICYLLMAAVLVFGMAGCGKKEEPKKDTDIRKEDTEPADESSEKEEETEEVQERSGNVRSPLW